MDQIAWLAMASTMPINYLGERFYYDSLENEFFILGLYDYLLTDEESLVEFLYPNDIKEKLIEKLIRIESQSLTIQEIPKLSIAERIDFQASFVNSMQNNAIQYQLKMIIEKQDESSQLILDSVINEENSSIELLDAWYDAKMLLMNTLASNFESVNNITLNNVLVWEIDFPRSVKKVRNTASERVGSDKKSWWKLW